MAEESEELTPEEAAREIRRMTRQESESAADSEITWKPRESEDSDGKPMTRDKHEIAGPETKRCPYCDEEIRFAAKKCKHCGEMLGREGRKRHRIQREEQRKARTTFPVISSLFFIGVMALEVWGIRAKNWTAQAVKVILDRKDAA